MSNSQEVLLSTGQVCRIALYVYRQYLAQIKKKPQIGLLSFDTWLERMILQESKEEVSEVELEFIGKQE